jgi:hypothetical protein
MLKIVLLCALILVPFSSFAESSAEDVINQALQLKLDQDQQWLNLLNYRRDFFWEKRSQADSPLFFYAQDGKANPQDELKEFIRAVFNPKALRPGPDAGTTERAQCIFPGRFLYLKRKLPQVAWPAISCERFENFRTILDAHSATYVFSSYYMNNPASAYGHSFLRLNRGTFASNEKKYELIDFGVGFSGVPEGATPASYALLGVMGFFQGRFEVQPYYYKVREYNNFESRDLWEYDLNLNQEEIDLLVEHIFELQQAHFDYLYFTENCSYRILALLDTARPSLKLVASTKPAVLPGDTVIMIERTPDLVKRVSYRPSGFATFQTRFDSLSPAEKNKFAVFIKNENGTDLISGASDLEKQELLDTAMDYVDFKYAASVLHEKGQHKLKKEILIARSEVNVISPELVVPTPVLDAPHEAHGSSRWNLGYLHRAERDLTSFGYRFALHDLLDPIRGYPAYSEMQMVSTDFSYESTNDHLQIEKLDLVEIVSLSDWNAFSHSPSWRLKFGWDRGYQTECENDCLPLMLQLGAGISKELARSFIASAWLRVGLAYDENFVNEAFRIGAGPAVLFRYNYKDHFSFLAEAWYRYDNHGSESEYRDLFAGAQYNFGKNLGLRLGAKNDEEYKAELNYYY